MINIIEPKVQIAKRWQIFSNKKLTNLIVLLIIEQLLICGYTNGKLCWKSGSIRCIFSQSVESIFILVFIALASGGAVVASQYIGNCDKEKGILTARYDYNCYFSCFDTGAIIFRSQLLTLLFIVVKVLLWKHVYHI